MKILLIKPPLPELTIGFKNLINLEPLHLEYLGACLPDHHLEILDMTLEPKGLKKKLEQLQPEVVGLNSSAVHTYEVHRIVQYVKEFNPTILTLVGGEQPTLFQQAFKTKNIDLMVLGCGYHTIKEIITNYERQKPFDTIAGLAVPKNGELVFTAPRAHIKNLDEIPFPNRELTTKYRSQYYFYFHDSIATIMTSEGCPYRCNFCCEWVKTGGAYICRSPQSVVDEIATIKEDVIFFVDDNAFADITRSRDMCRLIKERGIKKRYIIECSANIIANQPGLIEQWAEIGLIQVLIGLESYKNQDLERIDKGSTISVDTNTEAIRIIQQNGIDVLASFILFPDWENKDFDGLIDYIKKNNLFYIHLQPLTPLPGTRLHQQRYNEILSENYELYDEQHVLLPTKLPLKKFYRQMAKTYWRVYNYWRALIVKPNNGISFNPFHPRAIAFLKLLYSLWQAHHAHYRKNFIAL